MLAEDVVMPQQLEAQWTGGKQWATGISTSRFQHCIWSQGLGEMPWALYTKGEGRQRLDRRLSREEREWLGGESSQRESVLEDGVGGFCRDGAQGWAHH